MNNKPAYLAVPESYVMTDGGWTRVFMCVRANHNHFKYGYHFNYDGHGVNVPSNSVVTVQTHDAKAKLFKQGEQ